MALLLRRIDDLSLKILDRSDVYQVVESLKDNKEFLSPYLDFVNHVNIDNQLYVINRWQRDYRRGYGFQAGIFREDKLLGMCGLKIDFVNDKGEIGYWLIESETGKGTMSKVVGLVTDMGFTTYKLNKLVISMVVSNEKSKAIPERLGYTYEATLRKDYKLHGNYEDLMIYSLLYDEWLENQD